MEVEYSPLLKGELHVPLSEIPIMLIEISCDTIMALYISLSICSDYFVVR